MGIDPKSLGDAPVERARNLMRTLRGPDGCAWDREQDFASIARYTVEEAYEVEQAIRDGDLEALRDELGDLLLQVLFHAQIAEDQCAFDFEAVCTGLVDKMVSRHPHVFDIGLTPEMDETFDWEGQKAAERGDAPTLSGVAAALPALMRAQKLQKRAARVGFDWPDMAGPRDKIAEELAEVDAAVAKGSADHVREEIGDLLFSVVNLARHAGVDAEVALREANAKFTHRFEAVEDMAGGGQAMTEMEIDALEALWQRAKT